MTANRFSSLNDGEIRRDVGLWLLALAVMVFVMVILGGATRLTGSGLSMVEWQPLSLLPPLDEAAWQAEFARYRQSPQYALVNAGMGLAEFKGIFWLEYVHRLWGRLIGFAFAGPFVYFLARGRLGRADLPRLLVLFGLGALQGGLGWLMVKSGLVDRPEVSSYRLAAHLFAALLIYGALLWSALDYLHPRAQEIPLFSPRRALLAVLGLCGATIFVGALVAGLHAGYVFNTFPLMNGRLIPREALDLVPWWRNVTENPALVQFEHRLLAFVTWSAAMLVWLSWRDAPLPRNLALAVRALPVAATMQAALGVATLLLVVPAHLAAAHQAGAFVLFSVALWACHEART